MQIKQRIGNKINEIFHTTEFLKTEIINSYMLVHLKKKRRIKLLEKQEGPKFGIRKNRDSGDKQVLKGLKWKLKPFILYLPLDFAMNPDCSKKK